MAEIGKDKDCFGCSCNVCIAQQPDEIEPFKRRLLEKLEPLKEGIQYDYCSPDEVYGATRVLNTVIEIIKSSR
jgi:hypothetical protein